jgi:tRNA dimethylallyltransferase
MGNAHVNNHDSLEPVLILFGPTAVGKTAVLEKLFCADALAIATATAAGGSFAEIISADSAQVYRGLNIGSAKPDAALLKKLPHHLIDICEPNEKFNAGDFVRLAEEAVRDIRSRGKIPVVSGGTGFYISNLVSGLPESPPSDDGIRAALKHELAERGSAALAAELAACDAVSAGRIHINDTYRLLRALEVFRLTGRPLSSYNKNVNAENKFDFFIAQLERDRDELYKRINARTSMMMKSGLYNEVKALYDKGFTPKDPALRTIGCKEFFYMDGDGVYKIIDESKLAIVEAEIAKNSRNYAKRQITFFKNMSGQCRHYLLDTDDSVESIKNDIMNFLGHC